MSDSAHRSPDLLRRLAEECSNSEEAWNSKSKRQQLLRRLSEQLLQKTQSFPDWLQTSYNLGVSLHYGYQIEGADADFEGITGTELEEKYTESLNEQTGSWKCFTEPFLARPGRNDIVIEPWVCCPGRLLKVVHL